MCWLVVKTLPHSAYLPAQLIPTLVVRFSGRLLLRKMEAMIRMPIREHSLPTTAILVQKALLLCPWTAVIVLYLMRKTIQPVTEIRMMMIVLFVLLGNEREIPMLVSTMMMMQTVAFRILQTLYLTLSLDISKLIKLFHMKAVMIQCRHLTIMVKYINV